MPQRERAVNIFLATWAVLVIPTALAVFARDRFALHLWLNSAHTPAGDALFRNVTHLADTGTVVLLSVAMLLHSWRAFLLMAVGNGAAALVVQAIKLGPAAQWHRPALFLDRMAGLPLVPDVEQLLHHSFPSGHTTAAFGMGLAFTALLGRRWPAFALALLAALIGYSRVYLSQHFAQDVLAGAFIGTLAMVAAYRWLYRSPFAQRPWLDRSPLRAQNQ